MLHLKIEGRRKRGRPVKRWTDVVEEDMKNKGVVQPDAGDRKGWRRRAVKGLANQKICQDNKLIMMMMMIETTFFWFE